MTTKQVKRTNFKGISLEQKWKDRNGEEDSKQGNKSGNRFIVSTIEYNGKNKFT